MQGSRDQLVLGVLAMTPITGAFADPSHESAFAALLFRLAHPLRILLLALCLTIAGFMASRLALSLYDLQ